VGDYLSERRVPGGREPGRMVARDPMRLYLVRALFAGALPALLYIAVMVLALLLIVADLFRLFPALAGRGIVAGLAVLICVALYRLLLG